MRAVVVQNTSHSNRYFPASSVLILGEEDGKLTSNKYNFWLAEQKKTTGQGFTIKVDTCPRLIAGCQIKNKGNGNNWNDWLTREFRVKGSLNKDGPWEILLEDELVDTRGKPASLLNFTFEELVEIQFLKFELVSYWGGWGGGLQYFAGIPDTSKQHPFILY